MKHTLFALTLVLVIVMAPVPAYAAGTQEVPETHAGKPTIAVSILPQQYAVERIAGDRVSTVVLVGTGQSPHSYEPTPRQMAALSQADAWILSNTDFEISLQPKISALYPELLIIDGTEGVAFRTLEEHHDEDDMHDHAEGDAGPTGMEIDRHTWLGREPMKILGTHIYSTLSAVDPAGEPVYRENLSVFHREIDTVFEDLSNKLAPLKGSIVFVYHPAFGYFLDEFGITQKAVETGGKEPTAKSLSALITEAKEYQTPAIFVQAQFPTAAAENIAAAVGAQVLPLDPLAYDWMNNIRLMGEALTGALIPKQEL